MLVFSNKGVLVMKTRIFRRILWIALFAVLALTLAIGAMGAALVGDINGDGKITVFDAQLLLEYRHGVRELTITQQENLGDATLDDIIQWVFEGVVAEPEVIPENAIAKIENGDEVTYATTIAEMTAAIRSDGKSIVTLMQDLTKDNVLKLPYSCTLNMDGHSITTNPEEGSGVQIVEPGTVNSVTTIQDGKITAFNQAIRVTRGGIVIRNMDLESLDGICVGIYETEDYSDVNLISDSFLTSGGNGCIGFCGVEMDFTNTGISVETSTLFTAHATNRLLTSTSNSIPGTVRFYYDVHLYSAKANLATGGYVLEYPPTEFSGFTKVAGTASVTIRGVTYENLTYWSTPKSTVHIAEVTNGSTVTTVNSVDELIATVNKDGNTSIKLLQDVTTGSSINLPYSCSIDLNGHTITTGLTSGNGIQVAAAGTSNKTTTVKNGKLVHHTVGIRIAGGAVVVENMTIESLSGPCVGLYDPDAAYKSINRITGSTLSSAADSVIAFNKSSEDFRNTGISIDNSTLVSYKEGGVYLFRKAGNTGDLRIGNIHFGKNVHLYTYKKYPTADSYTQYSGELLQKDDNPGTVTIRGTTYTGLNHWNNDVQRQATKILAVGNSFCYRFVQEFYGVAMAGGEEIFMTNLYYPACTVQSHWEWLQNDTPNYEYWITSSMGRFMKSDIKTIRGALEFMDWDVITLQQRLHPGKTVNVPFSTTLAYCTPYTKNLYDAFRQMHPDAKYFWQQSWSYDVGHSTCPDKATQTAQYERIAEISDYLAEENDVIQILSGDAFQLARANPNIEADPTHTDYAHDGYGTGGQYLLACTWFETIFQKSCIGNTWREFDYAIEEDLLIELQKVAHQTVANRNGEDYVQ